MHLYKEITNNEDVMLVVEGANDTFWMELIPEKNKVINTKRWNISWLCFIYLFARYFISAYFLNRTKVKSLINKNRKEVILLSVWDAAIKGMNPDRIVPTKKEIFIHYVNALRSYCLAKKLIKQGIDELWTGHLVYDFRAAVYAYQEKGLTVFSSTLDELRCSTTPLDECYGTPIVQNNRGNKLVRLIDNKLSQLLPNSPDHNSGNTQEECSTYLSKEDKFDSSCYENVIFLHVFGDSPFHFYKSERIFSDYFEWIIETIQMIGKSKKIWWLRVHPHAKIWGDSTEVRLSTIFKLVEKPDNLRIMDNSISSSEVLKNAVRVVTFAGTVAQEAVQCGLRPVVINDINITEMLPGVAFKPVKKSEYASIIAAEDDPNRYCINKEDKIKYSKILHRDNDSYLSYLAWSGLKMILGGCLDDKMKILIREYMSRIECNPPPALTSKSKYSVNPYK